VELDQRATVLIGPNGAGKSTLLRILARQIRPAKGTVTIPGRVGFSAQHTVALSGFTVEEQVQYASWLAGTPRIKTIDVARRALSMTNLQDLAQRPAARLSGGELARLGIAGALACSPSLLILDEPTASLDPLARRSVTAVLNSLSADGIGLLASSHTATDVGPPFARLLVMDGGSAIFHGTARNRSMLRVQT
jgi:ABC-2 type transport system ATP-binding protein